MVRGLRSLVVVSLLAGGCTVEVAVRAGASELELGTGEAGFLPLEDESQLEVVLGPQGGLHVVGNVRVRGLVPVDPIGGDGHDILFWVMAYDGAMISLDTGPIPARLAAQQDGTFVCAPGHHVLVEGTGEEITGTRAEFGVEMADAYGEPVIDSRTVVLVYAGPAAL